MSFWSAVQRLLSASEVPKHRGKGGLAAKRNVCLYILDKFSASGNSDGDKNPWEMFTIVAGINLPDTLWQSVMVGLTCPSLPLLAVLQEPLSTSLLLGLAHWEATTVHGPTLLHSSCKAHPGELFSALSP